MYDQHLRMKGLAHDINGLMTRVSLAVEHLRTHSDDGVAQSARRIDDAIDQITAICKCELAPNQAAAAQKPFGPVGVENVLQRVFDLASIESLFGPRMLTFDRSVAKNVALETDAEHLFRVLFNLTINATSALLAHSGSRIAVDVARHGKMIHFKVADDGPGLPQAVLDYLFPRVGSAPVAKGRIGTGLITAVGLARQLGGELQLLKSNKTGTTFCLCLPASPTKWPAASQATSRRAICPAE